MSKRTCMIPECGEAHNAKGYCITHYMNMHRRGDPYSFPIPRTRFTRHSLTRAPAKLGINNTYDVSKWCAANGFPTLYLEPQDRKLMGVDYSYMQRPGYVLMDFKTPGIPLERFPLQWDMKMKNLRQTAMAWVETHKDVKLRFASWLGGCFPSLAVDELVWEYDNLLNGWDITTTPVSTPVSIPAPSVQESVKITTKVGV